MIRAMALLQSTNLAWYLLILWFTGIGAGALIGVIGAILCRRLKKVLPQKRTE